MIAKIAVSVSTFAIDKPYSYFVPEGMELKPGHRVMLPFGRGNRRCEGVVLAVEEGSAAGLKAVERCLDVEPLISEYMLRMAAFVRDRYFCTFYDAVRAMLPAGLWFQTTNTVSLTDDRSWQEKTVRNSDAAAILKLLEDLGGQSSETALRVAVDDEERFGAAMQYLLRKKWIAAQQDFSRRMNDKTERIATLASSPEEAGSLSLVRLTGRPTMRLASSVSVDSAVASPTTRPRRITVIRSAMARTSRSLWVMKTIEVPAAFS